MTSDRATAGPRLLGGVGALGGLLWAAIPLVAALTFYELQAGRLGLGGLAGLGALFEAAGLAVVGMAAGLTGVAWRVWPSIGPVGRSGIGLTGAGIVLLLPGSVVSSGSVPEAVAALIPLVFFTGLAGLAFGSALLGAAGRRTGALPGWLAVGFGGAMPAGVVAGGLGSLAGAGNLGLVLGLMVPYGLAWVALGTYLAIGGWGPGH